MDLTPGGLAGRSLDPCEDHGSFRRSGLGIAEPLPGDLHMVELKKPALCGLFFAYFRFWSLQGARLYRRLRGEQLPGGIAIFELLIPVQDFRALWQRLDFSVGLKLHF